jgi:DNA-binding beta-propeller fold protein YncE
MLKRVKTGETSPARSRLYATGISLATLLISGCGAAQIPTNAPYSTLSSVTRPARKIDLLYVAGHTNSFAYVYMLSYPQLKIVGKIAKQINGLCSDSHGNVYMTQAYHSTSTIFEYAHDTTKPFATLSDPGEGASACAIDPTTANLAVANKDDSTVVIYQRARGTPKKYYIFFSPDYVAYDPKGNLYALGGGGAAFAVLDDGRFRRVVLSRHVEDSMGVQWDGMYMVIGDAGTTYSNGALRQYTITGRKGVEEGYVKLGEQGDNFLIDGSTLIVSAEEYDTMYVFAYPGGGNPVRTISSVSGPGSMTISVPQ